MKKPHVEIVARGAIAFAIVAASTLIFASWALAACHAFTVTANPTNPVEGANVNITIARDQAVNPSSVRLRTVDETATGDVDFPKLDQRIDFTTDVSRTITMTIKEDTIDEVNETFKLVLSEGQGCAINPSFSYGEARVTIQDNDAAPSPPPPKTSPPPSPSPTPSPSVTASASPGAPPALTTSPNGSPTPSPSASPTVRASGEQGGGVSGTILVAAIALLVAAGAGGGLWWLRKNQRA